MNSACEAVPGALSEHPVHDRVMLNHYVTKSLAEYGDKMMRGSAMGNQARARAPPAAGRLGRNVLASHATCSPAFEVMALNTAWSDLRLSSRQISSQACMHADLLAHVRLPARDCGHAPRLQRRKPWTSTASSRATRRRSASGAAGRRAGGAGAAPRRPSGPASPGPRGMLPAYGSSRWRRARGGSCWRPAGSLVATRAGAVWLASCAVCSLGKGVRGDEPCGERPPG